jgi:hypothetical protein
MNFKKAFIMYDCEHCAMKEIQCDAVIVLCPLSVLRIMKELGRGQGRTAFCGGFCEHGNKPLGSVKGVEFFHQLGDYWLLRKYPTRYK